MTAASQSLTMHSMGLLDDALRETVRAQLRAALRNADGREDAAAYLGISRRRLFILLALHPDIAAEFPASPGPRKKVKPGG